MVMVVFGNALNHTYFKTTAQTIRFNLRTYNEIRAVHFGLVDVRHAADRRQIVFDHDLHPIGMNLQLWKIERCIFKRHSISNIPKCRWTCKKKNEKFER